MFLLLRRCILFHPPLRSCHSGQAHTLAVCNRNPLLRKRRSIVHLYSSALSTVDDHKLLSFLESGNRLECPFFCPESVYDICMQCWNKYSEMRPVCHQRSAECLGWKAFLADVQSHLKTLRGRYIAAAIRLVRVDRSALLMS